MTEPNPTGYCVGAPEKEGSEACSDCGKRHPLQPGSKGWFWAKRAENLALFVVPSIPLIGGIRELVNPRAEVDLTDAQRDALNKTFEAGSGSPSTVERVIVELDAPAVADRLAAAAPSLLLAGLLAFVVYALWRIEINMTAGKRQRPFTKKDGLILRRSSRYLYWGWFAIVVVEVAGFAMLRFGPAHMEDGFAGLNSDGSLVVLGLAVLVGTMTRVYSKGRKAYSDLEKIV